jgi:hypothetical protein
MAEYRVRRVGAEAVPDPSVAVPDGGSNWVPAYYSLTEQYGLGASMQFVSQQSHNIQTVEQEYQSYITALCSGPRTNMVKFWEVCDIDFGNT